MRVNEIMSSDVRTILPDQAADEAVEQLRLNRIHHLVVVEDNRVIGVVSDRDLRGLDGRANASVRDVMTPQVVVVRPETTVRQAANLLRGRTIGCLPVMEGARLRGILTVTDLLELVGRGVDKTSLETRWKPIRRSQRHPRVRAPTA